MARPRKLTPKENFILLLESKADLTEDKWGNFKTESGDIRYKIGKTSVRLERKVKMYDGFEWVKIWSAYYKDITVKENGKIDIAKKM